jgi:hypothetical protein
VRDQGDDVLAPDFERSGGEKALLWSCVFLTIATEATSRNCVSSSQIRTTIAYDTLLNNLRSQNASIVCGTFHWCRLEPGILYEHDAWWQATSMSVALSSARSCGLGMKSSPPCLPNVGHCPT